MGACCSKPTSAVVASAAAVNVELTSVTSEALSFREEPDSPRADNPPLQPLQNADGSCTPIKFRYPGCVDLAKKGVTNEQGVTLANELANNTTIITFHLGGDGLGIETGLAFAKMLETSV